MTTQLDITDNLGPTESIEHVIVLAFHEDDLLLLNDKVDRFPVASFERGERIAKTVLRELYAQTGALLQRCGLLGLLRFNGMEARRTVPVYVGLVQQLETPVLSSIAERNFCDIDVAFRLLRQDYLREVKSRLFYHAFKMFKHLKHESESMPIMKGGFY